MFSIYTSAFNIEKCKFDYSESLNNFLDFAGSDGEVVVSVPSLRGDNTLELLLNWRQDNKADNLKIFVNNYSTNDPEFDGKVKNFALENCTKDIFIQMDLDERFILSQRQKWIDYAEFLLYQSEFESFMIPILEPFGNINKIKKDHGVKLKWRMHIPGLKRGVVNYAKKPDGLHHDISLSDSTELINKVGELVRAYKLVDESCYESTSNYISYLKNNIYTVHLGYLSFDNRILRNKEFWKQMWETECGESVDIPLTKEELECETIEHNLICQ